MAIFIVFFAFTLNKPVDTKLVEYSARYIKHYSNWIEKVDGKDVTHEDVYYLVYDDFDTGEEVEIEISKNTFMYFQGLWKTRKISYIHRIRVGICVDLSGIVILKLH